LRPCVLLVDDEIMLLNSLARVLRRNCDVTTADNGVRALEILQDDQAFDTIICDLMMPRIDGPALYSEVMRKYPHLLDKFVFISGGTPIETRGLFFGPNQPHVLSKPVDVNTLLE